MKKKICTMLLLIFVLLTAISLLSACGHVHSFGGTNLCECGFDLGQKATVTKVVSALPGDDVKLYLVRLEDGQFDAYIVGTGAMKDFTSSSTMGISGYSLANVYIDEGVTKVGDYAFYGCKTITNVTIAGSVTTIGRCAFSGCEYLQNVTIAKGVTNIADNAFYGCRSLKSISLPKGVTSIGNSAFARCTSLESVTIPQGVQSLGDLAFNGCLSVTKITIPSSVTTIGNGAFSACESLTSIKVSAGNTNYKSVDGNLYTKDGKVLLQYAIAKKNKFFTVPNGVTTLGQYAFANCANLTEIQLPNGLTKLDNYSIGNCTNLASVTLPSSVTEIGYGAFMGCEKIASVIIPSNVVSIGPVAFANCKVLTSITFEDPTGWYISKSSSATTGDTLVLTDPAQNVNYLVRQYASYYWFNI